MLQKVVISLVLLSASGLWAADAPPPVASHSAPAVPGATWIAFLDNGFSIRHHHREVAGGATRLFTSFAADSFVEMPSASIVRFELEKLAASPQPVPSPAAAVSARSLEEVVDAASQRHGIDSDLIYSVIAAESGFNAQAVSPKGAQGLMQLMPATAATLGVADPFNPELNVDGGTRYLRELLLLYKGDLVKALAAYNAGPERVARYGGVPPFPETQAYVSRIIREFNRKKLRQQARGGAGSH